MVDVIENQIISKILYTGDYSIVTDNYLDETYFPELNEEFLYIKNHYEKYHKVPDVETFLGVFCDEDGNPTVQLYDVQESNRYLIDTIREVHLYTQSVPIIQQAAEMIRGDANEGIKFIQNNISVLTPYYSIETEDIIHSRERVNVFEDKGLHKDQWFIPTGFEELDDVIGGWQCGEELGVVFARTGNCKSWVIIRMAQHAWQIGKTPGYISPEMSGVKIGYRFDTINKHISNTVLNRGDVSKYSVDEYNAYLDDLSKAKNSFYVSTPKNFGNDITVSKLKSWVQSNKIEILFIDGITYLTDERYKKGDNKTTSLTNISEDLMQMSCALKIPVIVVVQSNRGGVDKETPELEDIRDSDGIAHNATKVLSVRHKDEYLTMVVKKNRDYKTGTKLEYLADIDTGEYEYVENTDESNNNDDVKEKKETKRESKPKTEKKVVF